MTPCYCTQMREATRKIGALYDEALAPLGINIAQFALMRKIQRLQPVSFTELGRAGELDRSTVGRNVRVLARMELVTIGRGEDDQRETLVTLAERGATLLDAAAPLWSACQAKIEERLGPARLEALRDALRML